MDKKAAARILEAIADLLELKGDNAFKIKAYRDASDAIARFEGDLAPAVLSGEILTVKGIGKGLQAELVQLVNTGRSALHDELSAAFPASLRELLAVPGLGPKKVKALHEGLAVASLADLEEAVAKGRVAGLKGFGAKTADKIARNLAFYHQTRGQHRYADAIGPARELLAFLRSVAAVERCELAGSIRRVKEVVKDVDLVACSADPEAVMEAFVRAPGVVDIVGKGPTKTSVRLAGGLGVDLRVVSAEQFPYAWQHFTGSAEHNVALRGIAKGMGFKSNEYGLLREPDGSQVACASEAELYAALGLAWIPPELREGTWEIEAAREGRLPDLVGTDQIQGVFHSHTVASDGHATLEQMVAAARSLDMAYLGISDHSKAAFYANGMDAARLAEQQVAIDRLGGEIPDFTIFKGIEADILKDGTIDLGPQVLGTCDFVIASIHSRFNETRDEMTERICKAVTDPHVTMLGHLTGRLLLEREPYELDFDRVFAAAAEHGVLIEINASPSRLDLDWRLMQRAKSAGVRFSINPDAHSTAEIANAALGVSMARKGGLEAQDLLNTRSAAEVREYLERRKSGERVRLGA